MTAILDADASSVSYILPENALGGYLVTTDHRKFLMSDPELNKLADAVATRADDCGARMLSWDVFDTALLREPKCEGRRFFDMATTFSARMNEEASVPDFAPIDALLARAEAARASYRMARPKHGNREGTLTEIAQVACTLLRCPDYVETYIETELSVEVKSLTCNPLLPAVAARLPDVEMMFVSDMYIEGPRIQSIVSAKFPDLDVTKLLSSADGLGSKRGGGVFTNLEKQTGLDGADILHLGDSLHSDFRMPREHGWNSLYLPLPQAERDARKDCFEALCRDVAEHDITLNNYLHFNI
jgi:hypothetical protein